MATRAAVDRRLLAPKRPRLFTLHHFLPETPSRRQAAAIRARLEAMDAVVMHSEAGRRRVEDEFGVRPGLVEVIPHGAFDYLTRLPEELPLPAELEGAEGPVILAYGLVRPYKGTDVLLEAFAQVEGAELWIVGMPHIDTGPLHELAERAPGRVRFVERYVDEGEIPAIMRRADLLVLPYRTVEQSGVLYTGLAFGKPMVLSAVGGFPEVAEQRGGPARRARRPGRARGALERPDRRSRGAREAGGRRRPRRRDPLLLGRDRPAHIRALREAAAHDHGSAGSLLRLPRPDRVLPAGLSAGAVDLSRLIRSTPTEPLAGAPGREAEEAPVDGVSLIIAAHNEQDAIGPTVVRPESRGSPR